MLNIDRREFVTYGAMAAAGLVGSAILGPGMGAPSWAATPAADPGHKRVLVAYDTGCGSTAQVAETISRVLGNSTTTVDTHLVDDAPDPSQYDAVVVGSAVRRARWLSDAIDFVGDHKAALMDIPIAYFLTCIALYRDTPQTQKLALSYMEPALEAAPAAKPVSLGLFAGALDYSKLNPIMRLIMKSKMEDKGIPEGDFRDFPVVKSWAGDTAAKLGLAGQVSKAA